jgi:hypothetical protein
VRADIPALQPLPLSFGGISGTHDIPWMKVAVGERGARSDLVKAGARSDYRWHGRQPGLAHLLGKAAHQVRILGSAFHPVGKLAQWPQLGTRGEQVIGTAEPLLLKARQGVKSELPHRFRLITE